MAAPVFMVSSAMVAAPALMTAPQAHPARPAASPHTVTAHLDAVVRPAAPAYTVQAGVTASEAALRHHGHHHHHHHHHWRWHHHHQATTGSAPSTPSPSTSTPSTPAPSSASGTATSQGGTSTKSSSGVSTTVMSDISSGNNLLAIAQFLVDNGYSKAAAAGVASCVDGESAGNPESVGSGGGGLIGWTPLGSAMPNSNIVTGNPAQDLMTQLTDILFYNSNEIGQSLVNELNSQTDPVAAADFFSQHFEKPAVTNSDVRPSVAEQIFSQLGG